MTALYDRLDVEQKKVYDKIVAFGKAKDFSTEDINIALQIAYVESEFGKLKDKESKNAAKGLFQYKEIHWVDRQQTEESQVGKKVKDILSSWGYAKDNHGTVNIYWEKQDDQIAMFYAELKIYADRFKKGVPDPAYNKVCRNIECPTDPYSRKALYIEATHHSAKNIGEVLNGWKKKVQPNLMDNLNYLKKNAAKWEKKVSQDDTAAETDKVAEATERDSERTTSTAQPDDAYSTEDGKRKDLAAGDDAEAETARRGDDAGERDTDDSMNRQRGVPATASNGSSVGIPEAPWRHAMAALGVKPGDVQFTPAVDYGNIKPDSFDMVDKGTSETIGSCVMTPTGCEMTSGDRKVVMDKISGSDVSVETYAQNDEGDLKLQKKVRIGDNDGITVTRPWTGLA